MPISLIWLFLAHNVATTTSNVVCQQGKRCVVRHLFEGVVDNDTVEPAIDVIKKANEAGADEIVLEINSPGGSVNQGFRLAREIEESDVPVTCVVDGEAMSMAAYILQSCDQRTLTKRSVIMFHEPSLGGEMEGQPNQWQAIADLMNAEREIIAEHCQHRMKVSMEEYRKRTDGSKMWIMTWKDALKYGAVDGVVKNAKDVYRKALARHK